MQFIYLWTYPAPLELQTVCAEKFALTVKEAIHFGCLAHARRLFVEAHKGQKKKVGGRALQALEYFKALYQVETLAKTELPDGEARVAYTYRLLQEHSVPLLEAFKTWLDTLAPQVLPKSLLGKAVSYTKPMGISKPLRNRWTCPSR